MYSKNRLFLLGIVHQGYAQQQVMFTQYMFNGLAINPAYAGSHESLSMTALLREQWTGIDGAPSTQTFSVHSPIRNQRMSVGLLLLHDKIGGTEQTGAYASYVSEKHAKASADYIISQGIDAKRITGKGCGESYLINNCSDGVSCSEEAHQLNRRTEFKIVKF